MNARKVLLQEFQTNQFAKSDKYERSSKRKEESSLYAEGDYVLAKFMEKTPKFSKKPLFFGPGILAKLQGQEAEIFWPQLGRTSIRNTNNLIHFSLPSGGINRNDFQHIPRITKMQNGRIISKVRQEEILQNLEKGKYKNAFLHLQSELDFIETEIGNISPFELEDFKKEYYSPEVLLERYNKWRSGTPEVILKRDNMKETEQADKDSKKITAPENKTVPKKVTHRLPTIQEEPEELKIDKTKGKKGFPLSEPKGDRISRRSVGRKDYRGMC